MAHVSKLESKTSFRMTCLIMPIIKMGKGVWFSFPLYSTDSYDMNSKTIKHSSNFPVAYKSNRQYSLSQLTICGLLVHWDSWWWGLAVWGTDVHSFKVHIFLLWLKSCKFRAFNKITPT